MTKGIVARLFLAIASTREAPKRTREPEVLQACRMAVLPTPM
jgi:hypothetical protein